MENVFIFDITGISPLLMNNPSSMDEDAAEKSKGTIRTKVPDKKKEAAKRVYTDDDGNLVFPSIAFVNGLWQAGAYKKFGKDSARSVVASTVFAMEPNVQLLHPDTKKPITSYSIDSRNVVIKATKGRIMRHRPMVKEWCCELPLNIDTDYIAVETVENGLTSLFERAGRIIGVGDYRPEKRGPFGRFAVSLRNGNKSSNGNGTKRLKRKKLR